MPSAVDFAKELQKHIHVDSTVSFTQTPKVLSRSASESLAAKSWKLTVSGAPPPLDQLLAQATAAFGMTLRVSEVKKPLLYFFVDLLYFSATQNQNPHDSLTSGPNTYNRVVKPYSDALANWESRLYINPESKLLIVTM